LLIYGIHLIYFCEVETRDWSKFHSCIACLPNWRNPSALCSPCTEVSPPQNPLVLSISRSELAFLKGTYTLMQSRKRTDICSVYLPVSIHFMGSTNIEEHSGGSWFSQQSTLFLFHLKHCSPFPRSWGTIFSSDATILLHLLQRYMTGGLGAVSESVELADAWVSGRDSELTVAIIGCSNHSRLPTTNKRRRLTQPYRVSIYNLPSSINRNRWRRCHYREIHQLKLKEHNFLLRWIITSHDTNSQSHSQTLYLSGTKFSML